MDLTIIRQSLPFKTMNTVLKDDTYGFLKTGNELSTYKIPLKHFKWRDSDVRKKPICFQNLHINVKIINIS